MDRRRLGSSLTVRPLRLVGSRYHRPRSKRPQLRPWTRIAVALVSAPTGPSVKRSRNLILSGSAPTVAGKCSPTKAGAEAMEPRDTRLSRGFSHF